MANGFGSTGRGASGALNSSLICPRIVGFGGRAATPAGAGGRAAGREEDCGIAGFPPVIEPGGSGNET